MATNFNRSKYQDTFEKRFGKGSYDSGLATARDIGYTKARAELEKAAYNERVRAFEAEMKEQKSAREKAAKEAKKKKEDTSVIDELVKNKKESNSNEPDKDKLDSILGFLRVDKNKHAKKDDGNFFLDLVNAGKRAVKAANPFDDVGFGDAMMKSAMEFDKEKSKQFDSVDRFAGRATNSASMGIMGNLDKRMRNGELPDYLTKRKLGEGGGVDMLADLTGYLVPGAAIARGLKGTKLGANTAKDILSKPLTKETAKKLAKETSKEGAAVGAIMSAIEIGGREALNPNDTNWKQNLAQFGIETGAGAVLDPLATLGLSKLASKVKKPELSPAAKKIFVDPVKKTEPKADIPFSINPNRPSHAELMDAYNGKDVKNTSGITPIQSMTKKKDAKGKPTEQLETQVEKYENDTGLYKELAEDAVRNSELWKDKPAVSYGRETLERNFEDIASAEDAAKLKALYVEPVRQKETERIKFVNAQRDAVRAHGIKPKSKDDKLVQMYGEKKISLDQLKEETPNWQKVVEVSNWYRQNYDELIGRANALLVKAGEKPIEMRKDYFPHYKGIDEFYSVLKKFGFDVENNNLPTDINGLTENFKPNKKWFSAAMQRKTDETTFGAVEGFDRYLEGISQLIYHTENIKKLRALERALRSKHEGETHLSNLVSNLKEQGNLMAGKKASVDRIVEERFGRKVYNLLETVKQRTGLNMLGYNVGSATTAFIPLTHAAATTSKKAFTKGMFDTLTNIARNDGFAEKSGFLTRRLGSKPLVSNLWNKVENNSMWMMEMVDKFTSQTIVRGKYYDLLDKGLPEEEAMKEADAWAGRVITDRSKGQQPIMFASKTLGPLMQFQVEVNNQLSFLFKDIPRNAKNKTQLMSQMAQAVVYGMLINEVYEKVLGRRPAFDPIGVYLEASENYSNEDMSPEEAFGRTAKDVANQLPFVSGFTNGGRYPINAALPSINIDDYSQGKTTVVNELMKPAKYLIAPAGGGQGFKIYDGVTTLLDEGVYNAGGNLKYPVEQNTENALRASILGKSSLPETQDYYDKPFGERKALGSKQTAQFEIAKEKDVAKEFYEYILAKRKAESKEKKMKDANKAVIEIQKDETLTDKERKKRIDRILEDLNIE
ncbi:hypothetical protein [Paenisporosarcina cavernae]|uniref:Large polyvalent protein associated domain-containing protein n=1 Tax=Paenisporosarcina cavernae TaxID=2320858 RepID=A0A385YVC3_9BACL|nr:hypothetical protein [Paenisporosarcina cavernae]AYC29638.1 hypothetical protein D3873_06955 [Paenisporosarcina cavernae]